MAMRVTRLGNPISTAPAGVSVVELPPNTTLLASTALNEHQAYRFDDAPIYCTQFHPELDKTNNLERFDRYLEGYARFMSQRERDEARATFDESPGASDLLRRFVELVFN